MERIILAFSSEIAASKLRSMLAGTGYHISAKVCSSGAELLRAADQYDDALVIMGFKLPDMTVNHVFEEVGDRCRIISVVRPEHIENISYDEIFPLPLPVNRPKLLRTIQMVYGVETVRARKKPERSAEENDLTERAKLFLMEYYHMTEPQAHRFIQKRSMDTGAKLTETAKLILSME